MSIHVTFQQIASNKSPRTVWILAVKNLFRIMIKLMPVSGLLLVSPIRYVWMPQLENIPQQEAASYTCWYEATVCRHSHKMQRGSPQGGIGWGQLTNALLLNSSFHNPRRCIRISSRDLSDCVFAFAWAPRSLMSHHSGRHQASSGSRHDWRCHFPS